MKIVIDFDTGKPIDDMEEVFDRLKGFMELMERLYCDLNPEREITSHQESIIEDLRKAFSEALDRIVELHYERKKESRKLVSMSS